MTATDFDNYKFQLTAGDLVTVNIHDTSTPTWRPRVLLLNSAGTVVAMQNDVSTGTDVDSPIYSFVVPTSGIYYVRVQNLSGAGTYNADVYLSTAAPPAPPVLLADYYNLTLAAGDAVSVGLKLTAVGMVHVGLWDPASSNWIAGTPGATDANWDETIRDYVAPVAGQYVLKIDGLMSANYSLVVARNAELDVEPNDAAVPEDVGTTRTVLGAVPGDDCFSFSVAAGERLLISTRTPADGPGEAANNLDPQISLYDGNNVLLAEDDNGAPDQRNSMLAYTFADPGQYTVRVSAVGATAGAYVLSIATVEPPEVRFVVTDSPTVALTQSTLPSQAELDVVEDHPFYGELWVRSHPGSALCLGGGSVDLQFNPAYGQVLSVEPVNANWTGGNDGIIDNAAGTLTGLTRTDATPSQGDDEWVLFARVDFAGKAPVDEVNHAFGPYNAELAVAQSTLTVAGSPQPASVVADAAKVYAVVYDINDDGRVNSGDFSYFSVAYGGTVCAAESPTGPFCTWADFDGSGRVLSGDLSWLSTVYRKYTSEIDFYDMPSRYRPLAGPTGARPALPPSVMRFAFLFPAKGRLQSAPARNCWRLRFQPLWPRPVGQQPPFLV